MDYIFAVFFLAFLTFAAPCDRYGGPPTSGSAAAHFQKLATASGLTKSVRPFSLGVFGQLVFSPV